MKRKIISCYSHSIIFASAVAAPFLALQDLVFVPTCIWVGAVILAMIGMFCVLDEKQPERENRRVFKNYDLMKERKNETVYNH